MGGVKAGGRTLGGLKIENNGAPDGSGGAGLPDAPAELDVAGQGAPTDAGAGVEAPDFGPVVHPERTVLVDVGVQHDVGDGLPGRDAGERALDGIDDVLHDNCSLQSQDRFLL